MTFKFEHLEVWKMALDYLDQMYELAEKLPRHEDFNLKSQLTRAGTSIALNIAEGSTGQTDAEQSRFLGMALRSLIETVACQRIIKRRNYFSNGEVLDKADAQAQELAKRLQAFRKALSPSDRSVSDETAVYEINEL